MRNPASSPSAVVPFHFESNPIRTLTKPNGDIWFVAADVCSSLGINNVTMALKKIPSNHIALNSIEGSEGEREVNIISEPGMYRLVLRSNKPQAEPFIEWVTSEVLPTIRKTGQYGIPAHQPQPPDFYHQPTIDGEPGTYTFFYRGQQLTVFIDANMTPWFRQADLGRILGYSQPTMSVSRRVSAFPSYKVRVSIDDRYLREVLMTGVDGLVHLLNRTSYQKVAIPFAHWLAAELAVALGIDGHPFLPRQYCSPVGKIRWEVPPITAATSRKQDRQEQVTLDTMLNLLTDPSFADDSEQSREALAKIANAAAMRSVVGVHGASQMRTISNRRNAGERTELGAECQIIGKVASEYGPTICSEK